MEATRVVTHEAELADATPATVHEVPIRIHHAGVISLEHTWWVLVEPAVETLAMRNGELIRSNGEIVRLTG